VESVKIAVATPDLIVPTGKPLEREKAVCDNAALNKTS
jgi:hypothetical protein